MVFWTVCSHAAFAWFCLQRDLPLVSKVSLNPAHFHGVREGSDLTNWLWEASEFTFSPWCISIWWYWWPRQISEWGKFRQHNNNKQPGVVKFFFSVFDPFLKIEAVNHLYNEEWKWGERKESRIYDWSWTIDNTHHPGICRRKNSYRVDRGTSAEMSWGRSW